MHRRSFLKTTVVGASAAGAGSCAHLGPTLSSSGAEVVAMVNELRAKLDFLASPATTAGLAAAVPADAHDDHLFQDGAQTLVLAGAFHSMPEDVRAHPAVQQLMGEKLAMMSTTAHRLNQVALATTPEQRTELTKQLKEDPALLDSAAQRLDAEADRLGLPGELRLRLRGLFAQVGSRMKQSASLAIADYSHKVARIEARMAEPRAFEREFIARFGEQAFWDFQVRQDSYAAAWAGQPPAPAPAPVPSEARGRASDHPGDDSEARTPREMKEAKADLLASSIAIPLGASLLGLGVLVGVGSVFVIASTGWVGVFVITAGVLLLVAGLIILIVGVNRRNRALHPRPRR